MNKTSWMRLRREWKNCEITGILILVNIIFFIIEMVTGGSQNTKNLVALGAIYEPFVRISHQYYRLITAMFLHFGFMHLVNNMVALYAFGSFMEKRLGKLRFLIIYLGGGVFSSIVVCLWEFIVQQASITAGASGAICALIGSMLAVSLLYNKYLTGIDPRRVLIAAFIALAPGFYAENISFTGHLGGLIGGFLITAVMLFIEKKRRNRVHGR